MRQTLIALAPYASLSALLSGAALLTGCGSSPGEETVDGPGSSAGVPVLDAASEVVRHVNVDGSAVAAFAHVQRLAVDVFGRGEGFSYTADEAHVARNALVKGCSTVEALGDAIVVDVRDGCHLTLPEAGWTLEGKVVARVVDDELTLELIDVRMARGADDPDGSFGGTTAQVDKMSGRARFMPSSDVEQQVEVDVYTDDAHVTAVAHSQVTTPAILDAARSYRIEGEGTVSFEGAAAQPFVDAHGFACSPGDGDFAFAAMFAPSCEDRATEVSVVRDYGCTDDDARPDKKATAELSFSGYAADETQASARSWYAGSLYDIYEGDVRTPAAACYQ